MGTGPNHSGGSRRYIIRAVEDSLRRLQTDHSPVPDAPARSGDRRQRDPVGPVRPGPRRETGNALLDVAGPLAQNRAVVCAAQSTFRADGSELFAGNDINEAEAMIELCIRLNRSILDAEGGLRSCPAFIGCYNEDTGIICYANAGHTAGLVRDGNGVTGLPATGLPLGLFSHAPSDACVVALEPGSAMLLVSRGVVEGKHKGEEFGLDRVKEAFKQTAAESPKELCLTVLNALRQFMNTPPTHDDVTALALVRGPQNS